MELTIHLTGCSVCRLFQRQSRWINRMVKSLFHQAEEPERKLDDEFKRQLQEKIDGRLK